MVVREAISMLFRPKGGTVYWCKFKHAGRVIRESTGETARTEARRKENEIKVRVAQELGPGGRRPSGVTLASLEQLHVDQLEAQGYDERRVATVTNLWRHLQRHMGEIRDAATITLGDLEAYEGARRKEKRRGQPIRGQTIRRERQALVKMLKLAAQRGLLRALPFDPALLPRISGDPRREDQEGKYRDEATIEAVIAKLSKKARAVGHEEMIRLVLATGLRSEELARAGDWRVMRVGRTPVLFVPPGQAKTDDPRELPLTPEAHAAFLAWRHRFAVADLAHSLERASAKAGIAPGVTLRDLRATYISRVAAIDLPAAQKLAGHRSVATTAIYVDTTRARVLSAGLQGSKWGSKTSKRRKKAQ